MKKTQEEQNEVKQTEEKLKQQLADVKKESHKRKKLLMAQQQLIHAGSGSYNKCPFCSKAFLNSSFLQSHINRRHGDQSVIRPASIAAPTQQVPEKPSEFQLQMEELRERLHATETQLQQEKIRRKQEKEKKIKLQQVEPMPDSEKEVFEKEINASAQKINELQAINAKLSKKRSGLGELEDDIEVEKELLHKQREEVAMLKEELGAKVKNVESDVEMRFAKQEKKWQKKVQSLTRQHADDIGKLNIVLEKAGQALAKSKDGQQHQKEVQSALKRSREQEELLRSQGSQNYEDEVEQMFREEQALAQSEVTPLRLEKSSSQRKSMMMPSDDEDDETTEMGTASHSLTQSLHSTYRSGELTLRTTQFLEELRKNPTLKVMRDELASLLQDHLQKIGIPPEMRGVPNDVLASKMALLKTRRQATIQKFPIFPEFRQQCDAYADQQARQRLKEMKRSPVTSPAGSRTTSPQRPQAVSPTNQASIQRKAPQSLAKSSPSRPSQHPVPKPQPRVSSPQRTMQSTGTTSGGRTGSSVDWTSTQWDSDDDDDDESEEEQVFQHVRQIKSGPRNVSPTPKPRTSPHQPAPAARPPGPQVKTVMSKPLHNDDEDDWDDDESETDQGGFGKPAIQRSSSMPMRGPSSPPKGQKVAELSRSIEYQLAGRKAAKPAGAIDVMSRNKTNDDESDSNWDVSSVEEEISPTRSAPKKAPLPVRGSHASDTTNTYGTSVWGSSSKAASTVPARSAIIRGSTSDISDVSLDDELDLDNI